MPSWNDLISELGALPDDEARSRRLRDKTTESLATVGRLRGEPRRPRNVLLYGSAFLQKAGAPPEALQLTFEDINGLMSSMYGMKWDRGLTLILHTPGGYTNAAETFVAYLRSKFDRLEVIVPVYSMSAGTMIALAADGIVMGRQSQLGPIDPQMSFGGSSISARAVVEQFDLAKREIIQDVNTAYAWQPILQSIGPGLLQEAKNALAYSETMVAKWLATYMFAGQTNARQSGRRVARHFNDASKHKSHGRRIDRAEARGLGVAVNDLEDSQDLQEAVLTAYHMMTLVFEHTPACRVIWSHQGRSWVKNAAMPGFGQGPS